MRPSLPANRRAVNAASAPLRAPTNRRGQNKQRNAAHGSPPKAPRARQCPSPRRSMAHPRAPRRFFARSSKAWRGAMPGDLSSACRAIRRCARPAQFPICAQAEAARRRRARIVYEAARTLTGVASNRAKAVRSAPFCVGAPLALCAAQGPGFSAMENPGPRASVPIQARVDLRFRPRAAASARNPARKCPRAHSCASALALRGLRGPPVR